MIPSRLFPPEVKGPKTLHKRSNKFGALQSFRIWEFGAWGSGLWT